MSRLIDRAELIHKLSEISITPDTVAVMTRVLQRIQAMPDAMPDLDQGEYKPGDFGEYDKAYSGLLGEDE